MRIEQPDPSSEILNSEHRSKELEQDQLFSVIHNLRTYEGNTGLTDGAEFAKKEYELVHEHNKLVVVNLGLPASAKTTIIGQDAYLLNKLLLDDPTDIRLRDMKGYYLGWGSYLIKYLQSTPEEFSGLVDQNLKAASEEHSRQAVRLSEIDKSITYIDLPGIAGRGEETIQALADKPFVLFRAVYTDEKQRQRYLMFREKIHNTDPKQGPVIKTARGLQNILDEFGIITDMPVDRDLLNLLRWNGAPIQRTRKVDEDFNKILVDFIGNEQKIQISSTRISQMLENNPDFRTSVVAGYLEYFLSEKFNIPSDRRIVQENIHQSMVSLNTNVLKNIEVEVEAGGKLKL